MNNMKKYKVELEGLTDVLFNKYSHELNKEKSGVPKDKLPDWEESNWERKLYTDETGNFIIPDTYIIGSLRVGAFSSGLQLSKKSGKKTIGKKFIDGNLLIETSPIINNVKLTPFSCNVKIGTSTIMTIRPKISKGWKTSFDVFDLNESFTKEELFKLFDYCGKFVGVGDWRPKFGRYSIVNIKEVN